MSLDIKIKVEIEDPEFEKIVSGIKEEPHDIPDNVVDTLNEEFNEEDNQFLEELFDKVGEPKEEDDLLDEREKPGSDDDNEGAALVAEIERLSRIIARRKRKLAEATLETTSRSLRRHSLDSLDSDGSWAKGRSRSPSRRGSKRRRSLSRERRRASRDKHLSSGRRRSTSRDRRSRRRSHSRDRRSRSRGRRSRSHRRSRSTGRRRKTEESKSGKKISFLEELEQIFAAKGQDFPEKEKMELLISRKKHLLEEIKSFDECFGFEQHATTSASEQFPSRVPPGINNFGEMNYMDQPVNFPMPVNIKSEPIDYNEPMMQGGNDSSERIEPMLKKIKVEKDAVSVGNRRDKVLKICTEAVEKLQKSEENPLKTRFFYTPTTVTRSGIDESLENRSPLNQITNVQFNFNSTNSNLDLQQWGLWQLSENVCNVTRVIGFDAAELIDKLSCKDIPIIFKPEKGSKGLKKDGKFYTPFFTDSGTQTDEATCSTCIIRQLRKYVDKSAQVQPILGNAATQTENRDELPIMNTIAMMNSSQLLALNDFSELIKEPAPTNTSELYRLREKLVDIYNLSQRPAMVPSNVSSQYRSSFNNSTQSYNANNMYDCQPQMSSGPVFPIQHNMNQHYPYQAQQMRPAYPQNMGNMVPPIQQRFPEPQPVPPPTSFRREDPRKRDKNFTPPSRSSDSYRTRPPSPPRSTGEISSGRSRFGSSRN